jgi:hypothetical protein
MLCFLKHVVSHVFESQPFLLMLTFWVHIDIQYSTPFHVVCTVSLNIYKSIFLQDIAWYDILAVIWIFSYILEDFRYNTP